ncbi:two-partner secretion domain-containing protein [Trichlorobacter ammonificans]|uniref:Filamentous haemagglutinin FhaB/tRNA nuclease CdiA-like TPS domain-containing protein n=1 Tax=Trichlorobacter ammonificans TaxID=2916410 RepID=A0ABM9DBR9_9BACT|nr:filamentous hemagglutinin N-terminal domain-containing protein [Trichlorobacter ammonificans]CAH2032636.1 protein of unknown function [Trichlorobacter ammonificans]
MNRVYRLIWSRLREAWVVVSEAVRGSGGAAPVTVGNLLAAALLASSAGTVYALPTSPTVVSGTAGIVSSGGTMTITNSANAIINWQGFSIGQGETARFIQPSALSAVLNRVTGGDPSKILGALQSNGKVLLINPNGILFGPNSRVDVNGLIASTLTITNEDFLAGRMKFSAGPTAGKVENRGSIATPSGGGVYLIAPAVENSGVITAPNGDVLLAAGKEVLLVDRRSPEIAVVVTAPAGESLNLGTIVADAGRIGMYGSVVRQKGRISANSAVQDAQGRIFLKSSGETTVASGSVTSADGSGTASGGKVIVWSDGATVVDGTISAKGGEQGGNGGFVETSGGNLAVNKAPDLTAPFGSGGTWLLDPYDIIIGSIDTTGTYTGSPNFVGNGGSSPSFIGASMIAGVLDGGTSVVVDTTGSGGGTGTITVSSAINTANAAAATLTLKAHNDITIDAALTMNNSLVLLADQDVSGAGSVVINKHVTAQNITASGRDIVFASLDGGTTYGRFTGGAVSLNAANVITANNYGFASEVTGSSLMLQAVNGIGAGGKVFVADVAGEISFSNVNNGVNIYNTSSSSIRNFTGINSNGPVRLESYDATFPTMLGNISSGGDLVIRMNRVATNSSAAINAGSNTVYLSSYNNSPVLSQSINGSQSWNLSGSDLERISAGKIVVGYDSFGNYTPNLSVATSSPLTLSGPKQLELYGQYISTGSNAIALAGNGSGLSLLGTLSGGQITLGSGTISVPDGTVKIGALSPSNNDIYLGGYSSPGLNIPSLGTITAQAVTIGSPGASSGAIHVVGAVTTPSASAHVFNAGAGGISQITGATITVPNLALNSVGSVTLAENNQVATLAASAGDAGNPNRNVTFRNQGNLSIGHVGGISGIGSFMNGVYDAAAPDAVISLTSSGAISQAGGALLRGKAVQATGTSVNLDQPNPTGIIAGEATGGAALDSFSYRSSNQILLSHVAGASGVTAAAAGTNPLGVKLISDNQGIAQEAGALLLAPGRGAHLDAGTAIYLEDAGNAVGSLAAISRNGADIVFSGSAPLAVTDLHQGVSGIQTSGGNLLLKAPAISLGANSHVGNAGLATDLYSATAGRTFSADYGILLAPYTPGANMVVGDGAATHDTTSLTSRQLRVGNSAVESFVPASGNISIAGSGINKPSTSLSIFTEGSISQTAPLNVGALQLFSGSGGITLENSANLFTGLMAEAQGGISIRNGGSMDVELVRAQGDVSLVAAGTIGLYDDISSGGAITIQAGGDLRQNAGTISNLDNRAADRDITLKGSNVVLSNVRSSRHVYLEATNTLDLTFNSYNSDYVDDDFFIYTLPFTFTYFGETFSQAFISSNGLISFGSGTSAYSDSLQDLAGYKAIAPAWNDWIVKPSQGKNVFISQPTTTSMAVKWDVERYYEAGSSARFETVLDTSGAISFNYGPASSSYAGDVTIGLGNGAAAIASQLMNMSGFSLNNLKSTTFIPTGSTYQETVGSSGGSLAGTTPLVAGFSTSGVSVSLPETPSGPAGLVAASNLTARAAGTLTIGTTVSAANGQISLESTTGSILRSGAGAPLIATSLRAAAGGSIGSYDTALLTQVGEWAGVTAGGSVYLKNVGAVQVNAGVSSQGGSVMLGSDGLLTISASVQAADAVGLFGNSIGHVAGTVAGSRVRFTATASETGTVTLGSVVNAVQSAEFTADNLVLAGTPTVRVSSTDIQSEIGIRPFSANRPITVGASGSGLNVLNTSEATFSAPTLVIGSDAGDDGLASGPLTIAGAITRSQRLGLVSAGTVTQRTGAAIAVPALGVLAGGGVSLNAASNMVDALAINTTAGDVAFSAGKPFSVVSVVGGLENPKIIAGVSTPSGSVTLATSGGDLALKAPVTAASGTVSLQSSGSILDATGSIGVQAQALFATAGVDIGSSAVPLSTQVPLWSTLTAGRSVYVDNYGAVATGSVPVVATTGDVTLRAHSPLTIGSGGVTAQGNILLEASASSVGGDNLTISGPVASTTGAISLKAGTGVVIAAGGSAVAPAGVTTIDQGGTVVKPPAPALETCIAAPATPGCATVLPSLTTCTAAPTTAGCSAVLPTLSACIAAPATAGCSAVLPTLAICTTAPTTTGCSVVLPQQQTSITQTTNQVVKETEQASTTPVAPAGLVLVALAPSKEESSSEGPSSQSETNGSNGKEEKKDKNKDKNTDAQSAGGEKKDEKPKKNYCN